MRQYELMVIFPLEEDQRAAGLEKLLADLAGQGVQIEKTDELGDRDLAYEIDKRRRARYVLYTIQANPACITELDRAFKLNQNMVRYLFVRKEG
jgi:small subunit ribosomal protein S6